MADALHDRGPDAGGFFSQNNVTFGHRRLSILDLSPLGHMPMHSEDGRLAVVHNGEIYNYVELRHDLRRLGHVFRSDGDTEARDASGIPTSIAESTSSE